MAALPVVKKARHSIHFQQGRDIVAHFTGAPMHHFDAQQGWLPLDTDLKLQTGNYWGAPGIPVRFNVTDRTVEIADTAYAQRTMRVGILDGANLSIKGAVNVPVGSRSGDSLIAEGIIGGASWQHIITLVEDGVRETLTLASKPTGLPANAGDWLILDTVVSGMLFSNGWLNEFIVGDRRFPLPSAHDANYNRPQCRRYARIVSGVQHIYTGIPVSWLATAVYPVTIDPDFNGGTADGWIYGSNAVLATSRSTSGGYFDATETVVVGTQHDGGGNVYNIYRGFLLFDTSSIGAGSTITQVNLKLVCTNDLSTTDFDLRIMKQDWSAQNPLSAGNREAAYDGCLGGTLDDADWRNTNGMSLNTQYASGNLNTAWVAKTGTTYYSLISSRDLNGDTPPNSTNEYIYVGSASNATAGYRPILTVVYSSTSIKDLIQSGFYGPR